MFFYLITPDWTGSPRGHSRPCSPGRASSRAPGKANQWRGGRAAAQARGCADQPARGRATAGCRRETAACRWVRTGAGAWAGAGERKGRSRTKTTEGAPAALLPCGWRGRQGCSARG